MLIEIRLSFAKSKYEKHFIHHINRCEITVQIYRNAIFDVFDANSLASKKRKVIYGLREAFGHFHFHENHLLYISNGLLKNSLFHSFILVIYIFVSGNFRRNLSNCFSAGRQQFSYSSSHIQIQIKFSHKYAKMAQKVVSIAHAMNV